MLCNSHETGDIYVVTVLDEGLPDPPKEHVLKLGNKLCSCNVEQLHDSHVQSKPVSRVLHVPYPQRSGLPSHAVSATRSSIDK